MEIRQLRYFVAVAEELNFNRAAERLHITQPALSRQIHQLEESIPAILLERNSKRVLLTEAGKSFYDRSLRLLEQVQDAVNESRMISAGQRGNLAVGIFGSAILDLIPQVLHRFSMVYPEIIVSLHPMDKDAQLQALRERRITIGFNRLVPTEPDIEQALVRVEPLIVAVPAMHPLAGEKQINLADMVDQPIIMYPRGVRGSLMFKVRGLYSDYGAVPLVGQEVTDVTTSVALVAAGVGLSIVPNAAKNLQLPGVVYRPLSCVGDSSIELICLYRKGDRSPVLTEFLKVLKEYINLEHD